MFRYVYTLVLLVSTCVDASAQCSGPGCSMSSGGFNFRNRSRLSYGMPTYHSVHQYGISRSSVSSTPTEIWYDAPIVVKPSVHQNFQNSGNFFGDFSEAVSTVPVTGRDLCTFF